MLSYVILFASHDQEFVSTVANRIIEITQGCAIDINIRMSSKDLDQVQIIAVQEGIPYQTLVSSIIHKYVSGYLVERKKA
jgi:predicted DNA binding CopG/RHH family protein